MRTAVVILNWNTRKYLEDFLPGLARSLQGLDAELVVADNGSSDDSVGFLKSAYPELQVIELYSNYGFTGGYNRAISQLLSSAQAPEYLVLINSDILVHKGWLEPLIEHLDKHTDCAACAPKLLALEQSEDGYVAGNSFEYAGAAGGYMDRYGFPFCRGRVLDRVEEDKGQYKSSSVFWVSGACFATRSSVWKALEGLDERFFAHMEEIDYCWRAQLSGYKIDIVCESKVYHLGGGTLPQSSPFKLKLNFRNSLLCLDKNLSLTLGKRRARCRLAARVGIDLLAAIAYWAKGEAQNAAAVLQAHREFKQLRNAAAYQDLLASQIAAASRAKGDVRIDPERKVLGLQNICIILQAALRGSRVFEYLSQKL